MIGDFKAFPEAFSGTPAGGTAQMPGFHTAAQDSTTWPYATMKVEEFYPSVWDKETKARLREEGIPDAGVVVEIDMTGFEQFPDIDAEYALNNWTEFFNEFASEAKRAEDLLDQFEEFVERYGDGDLPDERDIPSGVVEMMFAVHAPSPSSIAYLVRNALQGLSPDMATHLLLSAIDGSPDPWLMMQAIGQFRYLLDVPTYRIIGVSVLKPFFDRVFPSWDSEDFPEKKIASIEEMGFDTLTEENFFDSNVHADYVFSWRKSTEEIDRVAWMDVGSSRQLFFKGMEPAPRVEYHGTSLTNLLLAAPEFEWIIDQIPAPFNAAAFRQRLEDQRRGSW